MSDRFIRQGMTGIAWAAIAVLGALALLLLSALAFRSSLTYQINYTPTPPKPEGIACQPDRRRFCSHP